MQARTRKPSAVRREEIAKAAIRIIGERGLPSLTTATLAHEVGVTSGALFRHFDSRDDILREAVRQALARVEETFPDPGLPPMERLFGLAENRVALLSSDAGLAWLVRSDQARLILPADAAARLRDLVGRSRAWLLDALRDGAAEGSIRGDIEPEVLLVPIMGTIHALVGMPGVHGLRGGTGAHPARVFAALRRLLAPPRPGERGLPAPAVIPEEGDPDVHT